MRRDTLDDPDTLDHDTPECNNSAAKEASEGDADSTSTNERSGNMRSPPRGYGRRASPRKRKTRREHPAAVQSIKEQLRQLRARMMRHMHTEKRKYDASRLITKQYFDTQVEDLRSMQDQLRAQATSERRQHMRRIQEQAALIARLRERNGHLMAQLRERNG